MKSKIGIIIVSIVLILLQMTVLRYLAVGDIKPDIMLSFIVFLGIYASESDLFFGGVLSGILQDMTLSKNIGIYLIINLFFCSILSKMKKSSCKESMISVVTTNFIAFFQTLHCFLYPFVVELVDF